MGRRLAVAMVGVAFGVSCGATRRGLDGYPPDFLQSCRGWITEELSKVTVARIHGRVTDSTESPLESVMVVLSSPEPDSTPRFAVATRKNGTFAFGAVPPGRYVLKTCFTGFDTFEIPIEVKAGSKSPPINLALRPSA
jgi:hypothetical protein